MKILNLYAGIGGNRKLWPEGHEVTAVENNPEIAAMYQIFFPQDKVIVEDAHQYLLEHYKEFDFIWSSPPCPTHSRMGYLGMKYTDKAGKVARAKEIAYPDMKLYQEVIFLTHFFKGQWVVENTKSYYEPLIKPYEAGGHYFWSNFHIINKDTGPRAVSTNDLSQKKKRSGFDISGFKSNFRKDQILNNATEPSLGLHIFNCAFKEKQQLLEVA
jgi:DNA (cytosine-5)-methyltransferase 1